VVLTNRGRSDAFEAMVEDLMDVALGGVDETAPSRPSGVAATARSARYVDLSWNASFDNMPGTIRYRVFRDGVAVGSTTLIGFTDRPRAGTHSYRIRAVDLSGNRSAKSGGVTTTAFR